MSGAEEREGWLHRRRKTVESRIALVQMLGSACRWLVAAATATALAAGLLPIAFIIAGGSLAERISAAVAAGEESADWSAVYWAFAIVIALFLASELLVPDTGRGNR